MHSFLYVMLIGITGTPGTGKTSVTKYLESTYKLNVIYLNELIKNEKLYFGLDKERDSLIVDMEIVSKRVFELIDDKDSITLIEGHHSHHIADIIIVLRASPDTIVDRLSKRGYSIKKINENRDAEELDIILYESVEWCDEVFEIDTTNIDIKEVTKNIIEIIRIKKDNKDLKALDLYKPGSISWLKVD